MTAATAATAVYPEIDPTDPPIVAFDLDGVLARGVYPSPEVGPLIEAGARMLLHYAALGKEIVIYTARPASHTARIWDWLEVNGLRAYVYDVFAGGKPRAALYVDDKAWRFPGVQDAD